MLQKQSADSKGFTLLELMVVTAIIGLLAAIAIPNFIAYRNKAFCSAVESDANGIEAALADYFAIGSNIKTPALSELYQGKGYPMSGKGSKINTATITGINPNIGITITATDGARRCPLEYQDSSDDWDGSYVYTKRIQ